MWEKSVQVCFQSFNFDLEWFKWTKNKESPNVQFFLYFVGSRMKKKTRKSTKTTKNREIHETQRKPVKTRELHTRENVKKVNSENNTRENVKITRVKT